MRDLRQSTAITAKLGPLTDSAGAVLTTLTIQKADLRLTKNGGDLAPASADQGVADAGAPHDELGAYDISLNTTDTNTLGHLRVIVQESGQIVAWEDFNVMTAEEWDARYSTGIRQANVTQISGDATAADNAEAFFDGTGYAGTGNVIPTVTNLTNAPTNGDLTATMKASINTEVDAALDTAIPGSPTANSINERVQTMDNAYTVTRAGYLDNLSAGAVALASSLATLAGKFTGITLLAEWLGLIAGKQTGNSTARTELRATGAGSGTFDETTDSQEAIRDAGATTADIADAVWDEATSGHSTAGTTGKALTDAGSAGDPWSTALPGAYGAGTAGKIVGDNLNATVSSRLPTASYTAPLDAAGTRTALGLASANLDTQLSTIDTVVDSVLALLQDGTVGLAALEALVDELESRLTATRAGYLDNLSAGAVALDSTVAKEATLSSTGRADPSALAGALGGSLTPLAKVDWIFAKIMRAKSFNKTTGAVLVKNSAGTDIAKSTAADDGTTTSEGAYGAP